MGLTRRRFLGGAVAGALGVTGVYELLDRLTAAPARRVRPAGVLRGLQIINRQRRGDDLAVQRRHEHLDAFALDAPQMEEVLFRWHGAGDRSCGSRRQLVDELVDAGAAERGGGGAPEELTTREPSLSHDEAR